MRWPTSTARPPDASRRRRDLPAINRIWGFHRATWLALEFIVLGAATWLASTVAVRLKLVVLPILLSIVLWSAINPARRALVGRGVRRLVATCALFLGAAVLGSGIVWLTVPPIVSEASTLSPSTGGLDTFTTWLETSHFGIPAAEFQSILDTIHSQVVDNSGAIFGTLLGGATVAGELVVVFLLTAVLTFFLLQDGDSMIAGLAALPPSRGESLVAQGYRIRSTLAKYSELRHSTASPTRR